MKESEAKKMIKSAGGTWETFLKWMVGQNVSEVLPFTIKS